MKMVSRPIGSGYVKITFYSNDEWQEFLEVQKMMGTLDVSTLEVSDVKDIRDGFISRWRNYTQRFYSETSPHTFIIEE
ncbi:hypothetical protein [Ohtaekwangia koreensis]|uniref:Uncharacterized protein n=1 Tax=Ohtaekwangia koreensis TaxID=688867 RepID=A0A1T5KSY1_9BACT|nr:hypothetical protein [Ohtaekwangia koreensis]SKC66886.1 hypothetical protein SAMN05660236_2587 [Ohtaekwangia koreensis]